MLQNLVIDLVTACFKSLSTPINFVLKFFLRRIYCQLKCFFQKLCKQLIVISYAFIVKQLSNIFQQLFKYILKHLALVSYFLIFWKPEKSDIEQFIKLAAFYVRNLILVIQVIYINFLLFFLNLYILFIRIFNFLGFFE